MSEDRIDTRVFVEVTDEMNMLALYEIVAGNLTDEQTRRLLMDPRLLRECDACGHPGYMHQNADRQYEIIGPYGQGFEAGDILCEAEEDSGGYITGCTCEWYEGDNWR